MAKTAVATPSVDIEAIDRLEQKLKMLVTVLDRTRADSARATDELVRTRADTRARTRRTRACAPSSTRRTRALAEAEGTGTELTALRTEREQIRGRVDDMLRQIEALEPARPHWPWP